MKAAVVGVTGMVGRVMCRVLEEQQFPITEFLPVASERSVGKTVRFANKDYPVIGLQEAVNKQPDLALFSAGSSVSLEWAPRFAELGTVVVDNSSAFRMDAGKALVVPEVNAAVLSAEHRIIANPNCSTIQLVTALAPLHQAYGIERLVISTYQSMTGTGVKAVRQYEEERQGRSLSDPAYPHPIFENCLPHCDTFQENGYTREEMKLVNETRKILGDDSLRITATAVRVPVKGGHSESVNVSFKKDFDLAELKQLLQEAPGVTVLDDPANNRYPMPLQAADRDEVFVGRLRRDESAERSLNLWIVADNLRKGAATNTVQIAQYLLKQGYLQERSIQK